MATKPKCPSCQSTNTRISMTNNPRWVAVECTNCGNKWEIPAAKKK